MQYEADSPPSVHIKRGRVRNSPSCLKLRLHRRVFVSRQVIASYGGGNGKHPRDAANGGEDETQVTGRTPRRAPIGPAMPSAAMLAQAQQAAAELAGQVTNFPCYVGCCNGSCMETTG